MSIPPVFSDIAKSTNDLLGKDFPVGSAKVGAADVCVGEGGGWREGGHYY
jgi:hypothetical protein